MTPSKGYYSLIQFCPDPARLESANIGVLLQCPELGYIETKIAHDTDRVRRFFSGIDLDIARLRAAKSAIENRVKNNTELLSSLEGLTQFIDSRANQIRLSQPRPVRVANPDATLKELFEELVGERKKTAPRLRLFPELDQTFHQLQKRISDRVYIDHRINVPDYGSIEVQYGFYNGSLNWIRTQKFSGSNTKINDTASRLALEARFVGKSRLKSGECQKLIVVSCIPGEQVNVVQPRIQRIFSEVNQKLITQDEVPSFAQKILATAH